MPRRTASAARALRQRAGMPEKRELPRNQLMQPPTRTPEETVIRLRAKEKVQRGKANRRRTEERIKKIEGA